MEFAGAIPPNHRAIGEATDADMKIALQNISQVCSWEFFDIEFLLSEKAMVIGRVDGIGTGFPTMEWALKYNNPFSMTLDWNEILSVPGALREARRK